jgi:FSR family fosmidomycin resistance protein-like MFS transporter
MESSSTAQPALSASPLPTPSSPVSPTPRRRLIVPVLTGISVVHLLNDSIQAVIPAIFPILHQTLHLSFAQLGMIAFANNITASLMQPLVGWYTDKRPMPYLLPVGMLCTLVGMLVLAFAGAFAMIIPAVMLVGLGSAIFHPEGSRIVSLSAGTRVGFAQSVFQASGNAGNALAPMLTLLIFLPLGQMGALWFVGIATLAAGGLFVLAQWYDGNLSRLQHRVSKVIHRTKEQTQRVQIALAALIGLTFARSAFIAGIGNFYALFQINHFGLQLPAAQMHTFLFLAAGTVGTIFGGTLADHYGKRRMLMVSMLGCGALSWAMPFVSGTVAYPVLALAGFCIAAGFPIALLYSLELMPGKTGTISGLMFGLAFGMGAVGSVLLGSLADIVGIQPMMTVCCLLPLLGALTFVLPSDETLKRWKADTEPV